MSRRELDDACERGLRGVLTEQVDNRCIRGGPGMVLHRHVERGVAVSALRIHLRTVFQEETGEVGVPCGTAYRP